MYCDLIKMLPAPTLEQTKNFVELVANDHSWYKHLPTDRTIPFVFYLDPNADKKLVTLEEENGLFSKKIKFKFEEIDDNKLAQEYINKYSYWRYNLLENHVSIKGALLKRLLQIDPNRYIGFNIIDNDRFLQPLSFSDFKDIFCPIPNELFSKLTFNMSRYLHPVYKDSCDYFDDGNPKKSYAQMHYEIIFDLTEHLTSIANTIYNY